jgi:hypothetical protein
MVDFLRMIMRPAPGAKLSKALEHPDVIADGYRKRNYRGEESARMYDMGQSYVMDMLHHMYNHYNTVSFFSMGLLEPGMIIYYLSPFTLGRHQNNVQGCGIAQVRAARFQLKGRFGIVVNKFGEHLKVAEVYTFNGKGLHLAKPQAVWDEYVGLRCADDKNFHTVSKKTPLEVGQACCDILPTSSAHLLTSKVTLSDQIMLTGRITVDSLERLRTMVKEMGER